MKQPIRKLITLLMLLMCSVGAWADDVQDDGGLALEHNFGTKATVTFYAFPLESRQDSEEKKVPTASDIDKFTDNNKVTSITEICDYIVAYVVPADGYWTNAALLKASLIANESIVQTQQSLGPVNQGNTVQTRGTGIDGGKKVTLIKLEEGRNDGAGWYYYEFPEEGTQKDYETDSPVYESLLLDGFVLPKFDLSKGTASTDGKTYTFTVDDVWTTTLTIDEGKTEFTYNGSAQGPTKITNTSIVVKNGSEEAVSFATVSDHVTSELGLSANLTEGKAVNVGSYALTLISKELKVTAQSANTRSATTSTVPTTGIFINKGDIEFKISEATFTETEVSAEGYEGVYDGKSHTIKVTAPKSATVKYGTAEGTYNLTEAPDYTNVSTNTVYYQVTMDNYKTLTGSKTVKITAKELTATVTAENKEYDATTTATVSGTIETGIEGETLTISGLTGTFADANVGTGKTVTIDGGEVKVGDNTVAGNYSVSIPKTTTANITAKVLTITAKEQSVTYGTNIATGTTQVTLSPATLPESDQLASITLTPSATDVTTNGTITPSKAEIKSGETDVTSNYNINYEPGTLTITKKELTVIADPKTKEAGEKDPALTYTYEGLVAGDTEDVFTGALTRSSGEDAGEYTIMLGDLSAGDNYAITFQGAALTIIAKEPVTPDEPLYKIYVAESEGGEVITTLSQAKKGQQVNIIVKTEDNYNLESLVVVNNNTHKQVSAGTTKDKDNNEFVYFLMPGADVTVAATFVKQKEEFKQNIFILKNYYGEVVSNLLYAEPGQQVNLETRVKDGYTNVLLDELYVFNEKGEQLQLFYLDDPIEKVPVHLFFMKGEKAYVYNSFKGTNGITDETKSLRLDGIKLFSLSDQYSDFLKTSGGAEGAELVLSFLANILANFTSDGALHVNQGPEDMYSALMNLQSGWKVKFDFTGIIQLLNPELLGKGEGTINLTSGQIYELLSPGNLKLLMKSSEGPLLINSITVIAPDSQYPTNPDDPTAINGMKADKAAGDIFDLRGRKVDVNTLRKGVYIRNGKKVVIK